MAYTERDILPTVGALRVALTTMLEMPDRAPSNDEEAKQWRETQKNMKDTVVQCVELLGGGLLNDVNRIANALEVGVRLENERMELIRLDYENRGIKTGK